MIHPILETDCGQEYQRDAECPIETKRLRNYGSPSFSVNSYSAAYLFTALAIKLFFYVIKRMAGEKLVSGAMFGNLEYYLGMVAGLVRFACIIVFCLALLNAKQVTKAELEAQLKYQQDWAGSIYFPPFGSIQRAVFEESLSGKAVKQYLSAQLINVDPKAGSVAHENIGRQREREINEIMKK